MTFPTFIPKYKAMPCTPELFPHWEATLLKGTSMQVQYITHLPQSYIFIYSSGKLIS